MRRRFRSLVVVAGAALGFALGLGTASASASAQGAAVVQCQSGWVCLLSTNGTSVLSVREGGSAYFDPPFKAAEITNSTKILYCVDADVNQSLPPGQTLTGINGINVSSLTPASNGACLT